MMAILIDKNYKDLKMKVLKENDLKFILLDLKLIICAKPVTMVFALIKKDSIYSVIGTSFLFHIKNLIKISLKQTRQKQLN